MKDPIPLNARKEHDAMDSDDIQGVEVLLYFFNVAFGITFRSPF